MQKVGKMLMLKPLFGLKPLLDITGGGLSIQFPKTLHKICTTSVWFHTTYMKTFTTKDIRMLILCAYPVHQKIQKAFLAAAYPVSRKLRLNVGPASHSVPRIVRTTPVHKYTSIQHVVR